MMPDLPKHFHELLSRIRRGDSRSEGVLFGALYPQLHAEAARLMRGERPGHTLQATALVTDAYLSVVRCQSTVWNDLRHFVRTANLAMRHILQNHAVAKGRVKRGDGCEHTPYREDHGRVAPDIEVVVLAERALDQLQREDARAARAISLSSRGFEIVEIARELGVSDWTVRNDLSFARARMSQLLGVGASRK